MKFIEVISVLICLQIVSSEEEIKSLCDDPEITTADRLLNKTVRVYRGNYYWELIGLPARVAKTNGPFLIPYKYMAPLDRESKVHTVIAPNTNVDGFTYKYKANKQWVWYADGRLWIGNKNGFDWPLIPKGGFNAVLNDGGMGGLGYTLVIGFGGIRAYYYKAKDTDFQRDGSHLGYVGGKYEEKFPSDLTAAFAYPSDDKSVKYYVYLFRRKKYCYRPITGEDGCKEWRDNKELFGCGESKNPSATSDEKVPEGNEPIQPDSKPQEVQAATSAPNPVSTPPSNSRSIHYYCQNTIFLIAIHFILKF